MADHPNAAKLRRAYNAFAKGDMDVLTEVFAQDVVWHFPGKHQLAGDHRGRDAVFAIFAKTGELSGGTFNIELHDVVANDEHAVAMQIESGSRRGKRLDSVRDVEVYHMKNGQVIEWWSLTSDARAEDEFWS